MSPPGASKYKVSSTPEKKRLNSQWVNNVIGMAKWEVLSTPNKNTKRFCSQWVRNVIGAAEHLSMKQEQGRNVHQIKKSPEEGPEDFHLLTNPPAAPLPVLKPIVPLSFSKLATPLLSQNLGVSLPAQKLGTQMTPQKSDASLPPKKSGPAVLNENSDVPIPNRNEKSQLRWSKKSQDSADKVCTKPNILGASILRETPRQPTALLKPGIPVLSQKPGVPAPFVNPGTLLMLPSQFPAVQLPVLSQNAVTPLTSEMSLQVLKEYKPVIEKNVSYTCTNKLRILSDKSRTPFERPSQNHILRGSVKSY